MNDAWKGFPTPREVDRELYKGEEKLEQARTKFPAPLEVDRELYGSFDADFYIEVERFPAPHEVDRLFYLRFRKEY